MIRYSIVVAAYNVEKYIRRCLDSLVRQTYKKVEIIVVNDCSTDNTSSICHEYAIKDNRIHIIDKDVNEGLSLARNSGVDICSGDYVTFVDGDDFLELSTIEKCNNVLQKDRYDELVFASVFDRTNGNVWNMPLRSTKKLYLEKDLDSYFAEAIGANPESIADRDIGFTPWARVYKLSTIRENGLKFISERELIYEDLMFHLTSYKFMKSIYILNEQLYHYCENTNSLTQKIDTRRFYRVKAMHEYIKSHFEEEIFQNTKVLNRYRRTMLGYIRLSVMQLSRDRSNINTIQDICSDCFTSEIVYGYPANKLPVKQRFFTELLRRKHSYILYMICHSYGK